MHQYYVYIMTNKSGTLYIGVINNLNRRVYEYKEKLIRGFTSRYNLSNLVYYETCYDINQAIVREKQLKGWLRNKQIELIEKTNPYWRDLSKDGYKK